MTAYDPAQWTDLFVATASASAALAGLVFVAVSINIERILGLEGVPDRALATVLLLLSAVLVSVLGLFPGQSHAALGAELLVEGSLVTGVVAVLLVRSMPEGPGVPRSWMIGRLVVGALGTVPLMVGGVSVLAVTGGGLYWTAAGILGAIFAGVSNAWVLLVEILR